MTEIPEIIRVAVDELRHADEPEPHRSIGHGPAHRIARGDVRIVTAPCGERGTDSRICLVVGTDPAGEFADVVLAHSSTELATGIDGVVTRSRSGAPYDIVVETDLRGAVWTFQVGRRVGHLDEDVLDALSSIAVGDPTSAPPLTGGDVCSGSPLLGESDRRWRFKEDEGKAFRSLSHDCTAVLVDGGTFWIVDPELIRSGQLEGALDPYVIEDFWEWRSTRRTRRLTITDDLLDEMLGHEPPSPNSGDDLALELSTLAWEVAVDVSTTGQPDRSLATARGVLTARSLLRAAHQSFDDIQLLGERASA